MYRTSDRSRAICMYAVTSTRSQSEHDSIPQNFDPTQPGRPLPDNFFRPYMGYGDLFVQEHTGSSNYHSLQVSANRRFSRGLQFGLAYTWSKALGIADTDTSLVSSYFPVRQWNYGPLAYDRTHTLVVNYLYDLPKGGHEAWLASGEMGARQLAIERDRFHDQRFAVYPGHQHRRRS